MTRLSFILIILFLPISAHAHPGRLDTQGGHNGPNGYHYHAQAQYQKSCGRIVHVVDGDTLDIVICGVKERVRLLGINTPELGTPAGEKYKAYVVSLAEGKEACLEHNNVRDVYKRLLARVIIEGKDLTGILKKCSLPDLSGHSRGN